jgi:hypothetical protein
MGARGLLLTILAAFRVGRFVAVEVLFATGIPSEVYRQILVSFFKNSRIRPSSVTDRFLVQKNSSRLIDRPQLQWQRRLR